MPGPSDGDLVVERAAQLLLHPRRRLVRHHGAPVLGDAAQHHDERRSAAIGSARLGEVAAGEDLADQPAEQAEPRDAEADGEQADGDGAGDAQAHALR